MADLATVTGFLVTKIDGLVTLTSRMTNSQFRSDLDQVPAGETRYQIRGQYESDDGRNSATPYKGLSYVVVFHHRIDVATGKTEATHVDADMVTIQSAMTGVAWWRTLSGVREVPEGPDLEVDLAREEGSNVLSYGIGVKLIIDT